MASCRVFYRNAVLILAGLVAAAAHAQVFNAQLTGTVKDPSGALVPGAHLTAINLATKTSFTEVTNADGLFRFPDLPPSSYTLRCTLNGFKTFEQSPITLQVNQTLELNVALETGNVSEQVTVTAAPPALDTESATLGQVVTTRSIVNL